ncbi:MAG: SET domain-containing protein [Planctomycetota bacterium]|jgi:SET domain-containing protein
MEATIAYEVKTSPIHGKGIFATEKIAKDTLIGVYEGKETQKDGTYVLWCYDDEDSMFGIDGKNELRFANHSSKPNAIFMGDELIALRVIKPTEEITFHYGEEWEGV